MGIVIEDSPRAPRAAPVPPLGIAEDARTGKREKQLPFALATFISAFLLFQVQLLLGKQILPLFGGTPAAWTACLLVFQLLILAGYGYSHAMAMWVSPRGQFIIHGVALGLSALLLIMLGYFWPTPISPGANWHPPPSADPTWIIARFLLLAIGLPFFLLATTSPLIQRWFAKALPGKSPYRLYALSNAGSLLGLLSYPFLVEPFLRLSTQGWAWSTGYFVFLVCCYFSARSAARSPTSVEHEQRPGPVRHTHGRSARWPLRLLWIGLAACASALLLTTTNLVSQNVGVTPFQWVLELSLYLLSFILCFESDRWYRRRIFHPLFTILAALVIVVSLPNATYSFVIQLAAYSAALFAACMVCHGEAARTRPSAESLTAFYLSIATGGALGGIFVALIAPRIFPNYWEYPLGVLTCIALVLGLSKRDPLSWWYTGEASLALLILAGVAALAPAVLAPIWTGYSQRSQSIGIYAAVILIGAAAVQYARERGRRRIAPAPFLIRGTARIAWALLTVGLVIPQKAEFYNIVAHARNFYGVLSVVRVEADNYLALRHGNIVHGFQYQDAQRRQLATGYFGPRSGANIVIRNWAHHPMRVGLVGMGVGTLAALAQAGDVFRFYEINPDVYRWSSGEHPYFTYLRDSRGKIEVVLGDARLSLAQESSREEFQQFDVLVLDAFSSDAIPMHLLTREAFSVYEKHLRAPASVIAVHISNQTLDLRPVLAGISREFGYSALRVSPLLPTGPWSQSDWILLSHDPASLSNDAIRTQSEPFLAETRPVFWSDDYCDLLSVIRWRN
jgi:hypothetical protein